MYKFPQYFLILVSTLLVACGTSPTPISDALNAPSSRVFTAPAVQSSTPSRLTIIRDSGMHGAEHVVEIFVNGSMVAELRQGEKHSVSVDPGVVFIEARFHNIMGRVPPVQVETVLSPGKSYYYRVGMDELTLRLLRDLSLSR